MGKDDVEKDVRQVIEEAEKVPVRGVGDVVANVTKKFGLRECGGCKKRRARLNALFPFKNK